MDVTKPYKFIGFGAFRYPVISESSLPGLRAGPLSAGAVAVACCEVAPEVPCAAARVCQRALAITAKIGATDMCP